MLNLAHVDFEAMEIVRAAAEKHALTMAEVALRWMSHHSQMKRVYGDSVLIGASSTQHIEQVRRHISALDQRLLLSQNLLDLEKGPLPDEMVKALDEAWEHVRPVALRYHL